MRRNEIDYPLSIPQRINQPFIADLFFVEILAGAEGLIGDLTDGGKNRAAASFHRTKQVVIRHASGAEHVAERESMDELKTPLLGTYRSANHCVATSPIGNLDNTIFAPLS